MARKTAGKRKEQVAVPAEELRVADMPVSQLMKLLGIPAPGEARVGHESRAAAWQPINPKAKVADLTVRELLQLLAAGHW
jgi:hypothetical protein